MTIGKSEFLKLIKQASQPIQSLDKKSVSQRDAGNSGKQTRSRKTEGKRGQRGDKSHG